MMFDTRNTKKNKCLDKLLWYVFNTNLVTKNRPYRFKTSKIRYFLTLLFICKKYILAAVGIIPNWRRWTYFALTRCIPLKTDCYGDYTLNITSKSLRLRETSLMTKYVAVLRNQFTQFTHWKHWMSSYKNAFPY